MKICFLCNHIIALPALGELLREKEVVGIGVPAIEHEATSQAHAIAQQHNVAFTTFEPQQLEQSLSEWLTQIQADLVVVFSFPYRIPEGVLGLPAHGFYNVHPGPLPAYRGPDPVFWQIANLEPHAGLSLHRMEATFDTGPIVDSVDVPIAPNDTYSLYVHKLASAAKERLAELVDRLPSIEGVAQAAGEVEYRSRPQPKMLVVDWNGQSATQVDALIRACNHNYGGAITGFRGSILRLFQARIGEDSSIANPPGTILCADPDAGLSVQCRGNSVVYLEIIHTESGVFSGSRLVSVASIQPGEEMTMPGL